MPKDPNDTTETPTTATESDLGRVEPLSESDMTAFDAALDAAGVVDKPAEPEPGKETPPAAEPKKEGDAALAVEPKKEVTPPAAEPKKEGEPAAPEVKLGEPTAAEKATKEAEEAKKIESIDLEAMKPPVGISKANIDNFKAVRDAARHFKGKATALEQQVTELKAKGPAGIPENVQKELEDHRNFRKIFDAENDPEFKAQFDSKITTTDESIFKILKAQNLPEAVEKSMRDLGVDKIAPEWWTKNILEKLPFIDRKRVEDLLVERANLHDKKREAVESFSTKREEFLKGSAERDTAEANEYKKKIQDHVAVLTKDVAWAKPKEIPAGATAEEKKAIEEHNSNQKYLATQFDAALWPKTAEERAEIAAAATASIVLSVQLTEANKALEAEKVARADLQKQLNDIKSAGKLPGSKLPGKEAPPDTSKMSDEDAVEAGLSAAESR